MLSKYLLGAIAGLVLVGALAFVGGGYLNTRHAERKAAELRTRARGMTDQELARAVAQCDAPAAAGTPAPPADYCEDVAREIDARPLEMVRTMPSTLAAPALRPQGGGPRER